MNARRVLSILALLVLAAAPQLTAQCVSLTAIGSTYSQDFNTLASSGTSSTTPTGWRFSESPGNLLYTAGTGSSNSGDTYSFGPAASAERAFGGLQSGAVIPTV